jgi:hypothetical protein
MPYFYFCLLFAFVTRILGLNNLKPKNQKSRSSGLGSIILMFKF